MLVKVLEETLAVKSVFFNNFLESQNDVINDLAFLLCRLSTAIVGACACIVEGNINLLFEALLGENLVYEVTEFSPPNVLTLLWCFEVGGEKIELQLR